MCILLSPLLGLLQTSDVATTQIPRLRCVQGPWPVSLPEWAVTTGVYDRFIFAEEYDIDSTGLHDMYKIADISRWRRRLLLLLRSVWMLAWGLVVQGPPIPRVSMQLKNQLGVDPDVSSRWRRTASLRSALIRNNWKQRRQSVDYNEDIL